jgi:hypothetical protein
VQWMLGALQTVLVSLTPSRPSFILHDVDYILFQTLFGLPGDLFHYDPLQNFWA